MKTFTHLLCVLILSIVLFACNNVHFLKEESYRNQVAQDFEQKKQALPHGDLFAIFADSILSVYEREALMFLYAYMPIGDVTDYPGDYYLENVRLSKQTRDEMPWGKEIPDEVTWRMFGCRSRHVMRCLGAKRSPMKLLGECSVVEADT